MSPKTRRCAAGLAAALLLSLTACTEDEPAPAPPAAPAPSATPRFDVRDEATAAVMALVPASATSLSVTDLTRVRLQLGVPDLTGQAGAEARARFWERAEREAPLLTEGLLRPVDARLAADYGFTQDDVRWEGRWTGPDGDGWVLSFRLGLDMASVRRAVEDGVGPLKGAEVRAADSLVVVGAADDGMQSWAAEPALRSLGDFPADATYVERGCVEAPSGVDTGRLDPLEAWAIGLQGGLATARLGELRSDSFERLRLGETWPARGGAGAFSDGFRAGVADPSTGRVGYRLVDPVVAARLVQARVAPYAACAD